MAASILDLRVFYAPIMASFILASSDLEYALCYALNDTETRKSHRSECWKWSSLSFILLTCLDWLEARPSSFTYFVAIFQSMCDIWGWISSMWPLISHSLRAFGDLFPVGTLLINAETIFGLIRMRIYVWCCVLVELPLIFLSLNILINFLAEQNSVVMRVVC